MKSFVLIITLFVIIQGIPAQDTLRMPAAAVEKVSPGIPVKKFNTNLQLGSSFSSFSGNGSAFSSWVMPDFSYGLTKKFMISAGIGYINTQVNGFSPWYSGVNENEMNGNFSTGLVYLSGKYFVNTKLTITGSAYKYFDLTGSPVSYPWLNNNAKGFNMNVDYKIAEGFHIQAGFGYHQDASPYTYPGTGLFGDNPFRSSFPPFPGY